MDYAQKVNDLMSKYTSFQSQNLDQIKKQKKKNLIWK